MSTATFEQYVVLAKPSPLKVRLAFDGKEYVYSVWRGEVYLYDNRRPTRKEADMDIRNFLTRISREAA